MPITDAQMIELGVKQGAFPEILYKYRPLDKEDKKSADRTLDILENARFWFPAPKSFNDPFDCNLSETRGHKKKHYRQYFSKVGLTIKQYADLMRVVDKSPAYARELAIQARNDAINSRGILSLSKVHDQILMWSHYASSHTGIVIGLELLKDPEFFHVPWKVNYQKGYEELNYYADQMDSIKRNVSTKSDHWEYEKEIRVVKQRVGHHSFKREAVRAIYFGCRMSERQAKEIINNCRAWGYQRVRFFKANPVHGKFQLTFTEMK